jgi:hypothetical protein
MKDFFKNKENLILFCLILLIFLNFFDSCSIKSKLSTIDKNVKQIKFSQDTLKANVLPYKDIIKEIKIDGLRTSKRILYDNNAIIRTTVRPDDRMNYYDQEINKLENEKVKP